MAVTKELKEGVILSFYDPDSARIKNTTPGEPHDEYDVFQPNIQVEHPNPNANIYFIVVTISTPGGDKVIIRDIKKR